MAVEIWSDGSSNGKSNSPCGWGFVIVQNGDVLYANYGYFLNGTNNAAELEGACQGIEAWARLAPKYIRDGETVTLISDSQITLGLATGQYGASKNVELAARLARLYKTYCTDIRWVRGHVGTPANECVDRLAKRGRREATLSLRHDALSRDDGSHDPGPKDSRQA